MAQPALTFVFPPHIQAGIAKGIYAQVVRGDGTLVGVARDVATGRFVGLATGHSLDQQPFLWRILLDGGMKALSASPTSPLSPLLSGVQMLQVHRGFQKTYQKLDVIQAGLQSLQQSVGVLQATTALIGVGTVAGVVLSAVNLHQTLKLREDVRHLKIEVKDGFIDLKKVLKSAELEIIQHIDRVAQDVEFKHHRTILIQAYGRFTKALICLNDALKLPDTSLRNMGITNAQQMLYGALADYDAPQLLQGVCAAGQLRRQECVWAIDQAITKTYELLGAYDVVDSRLSSLQEKIRDDSLKIIDSCESSNELDFLFPEMIRVQTHDLVLLNTWQNHVVWLQELTPREQELLESEPLVTESSSKNTQANLVTVEPLEQELYETLKAQSHFLALRDVLKFTIQPSLRQKFETSLKQHASRSGYQGIALSKWDEVPDLTIANLHHYFKAKLA
ncbi:hypothetical protein C7B76_30160 [filamentous cyanobacterium CCP2]|nr:hypothetical protein C7B76_30160 [filamentous cyanobacterium CCP2]